MKDRKIIQISNSAKQLFALCDDGSVWAFAPHNGSVNNGFDATYLFNWERVSTEWVTDNEHAEKVKLHLG